MLAAGTTLGGAIVTCGEVCGASGPEIGIGVNLPWTNVQYAATREADAIAGSFPIVRFDYRMTSACSHSGVRASTFADTSPPLKVDLLISGELTMRPDGRFICHGYSSASGTGIRKAIPNAQDWAVAARALYKDWCGADGRNPRTVCPEIEVLNEPGGRWFWGGTSGSRCSSKNPSMCQDNADQYAEILRDTFEAFKSTYGSSSPILLASYDGGYRTSIDWGTEVWSNYRGSGHIDVSDYVGGITVHPYGTDGSAAPANLGSINAAYAATGLPVYVTEIGWSTDAASCAARHEATPCEPDPSKPNTPEQWSETQQAQNYYNFVRWVEGAWGLGPGVSADVVQVIAYSYGDAGPNLMFGVVENPHAKHVARKPAWVALEEADRFRSCTVC